VKRQVLYEMETGRVISVGYVDFRLSGGFDETTHAMVENELFQFIPGCRHDDQGNEVFWYYDAASGTFGPKTYSVVLTATSYQAAASAVNSIDDGVLWGVSVASAERDSATVTFVTADPDSLIAEALSRGWIQ